MEHSNCAITHSVLFAYPEKLIRGEGKQYMADKREELIMCAYIYIFI